VRKAKVHYFSLNNYEIFNQNEKSYQNKLRNKSKLSTKFWIVLESQTWSWIYIIPGTGQIPERQIHGPGKILTLPAPAKSYPWSFTDLQLLIFVEPLKRLLSRRGFTLYVILLLSSIVSIGQTIFTFQDAQKTFIFNY
jgi:hypothetical protein